MPLDIGVGIILAIAISEIFSLPLTILLVLGGIGATLLPDIDVVTAVFGRWRHREITHYPIVYVPIIVLAFIFLPLPYALLIALGITAHFIHDTIGTGWGIAWFWPFTTRRYLLFPEKSRRAQMGSVVSWIPEDKPEYAHEGSHMTWIRDIYLRPNTVAYVEYGVFLLSLLILLYVW